MIMKVSQEVNMQQPTVIVIGSNHHNTLGLIRSLGEKNLIVDVILEPSNLQFCNLRFSKYINKIHYLNNLNEIEDKLNYYRRKSCNNIVLCGSDQAVAYFDAHYDELKDNFIFFNAGEKGRINFLLNKSNTFPIAEKYGFNIIKTWIIIDKDRLPNDITYPCFIKGNNSIHSSKSDISVCQNEAELKESLHNGAEYLVQEYIIKEHELDIIGFAFNNGNKVIIPGAVRKIRDYTESQSNYIRLDNIKLYPEFKHMDIEGFIRELGYEGIFSIEVIYNKGKYYFLEINLRNDGACWIYTAAGINFPYLWFLYANNRLEKCELENIKIKKSLYLMQLDDLRNIFKNRVTFLQWVKDFFKTRCFFVLNRKDIKPFIYQCYIPVRQLLKKLSKKYSV